MPAQSELKIAIGKFVAYAVNPLTWGTAATQVVEGLGERLQQRAEVRRLAADIRATSVDAGSPPSAFLREEQEIVQFRGREAELSDLRDWALGTDEDVSVFVVTGPPGSGKSRLARRFWNMATEWNDPWLAGPLLEQRGLDGSHCQPLLHAWNGPILLVLDYAERRADQLNALLTAATDAAAGRRHQIRLLLLAREAGEWLDSIEDWPRHRFDSPLYYDRLRPMRLRPLPEDSEVGSVTEEFKRARAAFRETLGGAAEEPGSDGPYLEELARMAHPEALDVHIAALLAAFSVHGQDERQNDASAEPATLPEQRLLRDIIGREGLHWDRIAAAPSLSGQGLTRSVMTRVVAWLSLTGPRNSMEEMAAALACLPEMTRVRDSVRLAICDALRELYPQDGLGVWVGLRPDRLTAFLFDRFEPSELAEICQGLSGELLEWLLRYGGWHGQRYGDAAARPRLAAIVSSSEHAIASAVAVAPEFGDTISRMTLEAFRQRPSFDVARMVERKLPKETVALRELAAEAMEILVGESDDGSEKAGRLNNLSVRLSDLGRWEDALAAIEDAVLHYRELAAARPDAFLPDLVMSLNNLSNCLSDLGRREEALAAIEEAVSQYRDLAAARPAAFRPDLAMSLNNLSGRLSELGRREEALSAIEEAVSIRRDLATARPDAFRPDLTSSLNNLSNCLSDLGRWEEALAAGEEAVSQYRELAAARPDAFRPGLAMSLNTLSNCLSELGRREEALAAIEEAVSIRRDLAAVRPDAFRPDLASSLNNLSGRLSELGQREEALAAIEESVSIRRDLAAARPDAFRPYVASSLNNLSGRLSELGRREEALAAIEEAVSIRRDLAAARPDAFRPDLAMSLNNLSNGLPYLGRREEALAAIEEAVSEYRDLAAARPDAFRPGLAMSLNNLSNRLSELGRREEALAAIEEAVLIRRDLAAARPDAFLPDLAMSLNNLSIRLSELGRREEALAAIENAVSIRRDLAAAWPDAFLPDLAMSLSVSGDRLKEIGRVTVSIAPYRESVELLAPFFRQRPADHARNMAEICQRYISACEEAEIEPDNDLLAPVLEELEALGGGIPKDTE